MEQYEKSTNTNTRTLYNDAQYLKYYARRSVFGACLS